MLSLLSPTLILSGTGWFEGIDPGADLFAEDLFLGGGLGGKVFLGLAGGRGTLKTVSFWGVTAKISVSALVGVS
jgi:hypothetical protein